MLIVVRPTDFLRHPDGTPSYDEAVHAGRQAAQTFHGLVPAHLLTTDPDRLPDREAWAAVEAWSNDHPRWEEITGLAHFDMRGLWLYGPTGGGKSRAALRLCLLHLEERSDPIIYGTLEALAEGLASRNREQREALMADLVAPGSLLVVDAVSPSDISGPLASALSDVLDRHGPALHVFTSRFPLDAFFQRCVRRGRRSDDDGGTERDEAVAGLARRLRESVVGVRFDPANAQEPAQDRAEAEA